MFKDNNNKIIILIVLLATISNGILFWYSAFDFSCQLLLFENILIPFFATPFLIPGIRSAIHSDIGAAGALIGTILGFFPATSMLIVNWIMEYFLGGFGKSSAFKGLAIQNRPDLYLLGFTASISLWLGLIMVSTLFGFISSYFFRQRASRTD